MSEKCANITSMKERIERGLLPSTHNDEVCDAFCGVLKEKCHKKILKMIEDFNEVKPKQFLNTEK